jgi:hypothetical protein
MNIQVNISETEQFTKEISRKITYGLKKSAASYLAKHLGAHTAGGRATFLIWHPRFRNCIKAEIEFFIPKQHFTFDKPEQHVNMQYFRFDMSVLDEYACIIIDGLPAGNRDQFGAFYQFRLHSGENGEQVVRDPMAWSMPYGIYAPAEVYDVEMVRAGRKDAEYYRRLDQHLQNTDDRRISPPVNLLEIHTATATQGGTLLSLSNRYRQIASAIKNSEELTPDEKNLVGFDAIELMPVEPVIEHPDNHDFWSTINTPRSTNLGVVVVW